MAPVRALPLLLLLVACGDEGTPAPLPVTLDVMTINLRHDENEWERRFPLIADEIVRLDPDLIGLQEIEIMVDQTSALLDLIAERGGPSYEAYEEEKWPPYGALTGEGIGILSRYPILDSEVKNLIEGGRVAVWTRVEIEPGHEIDFYNTHLESDGDDSVRAAQAGFILDFMEEMEPESTHLSFLTGDMNATPDTGTYDVFAEGGLVDSYLEVHGDETETTGNTSTIVLMEGAFDQDPMRRIDYVFAESAVPSGSEVAPTDSTVCFENHDEAGFYPSDHLGVMTTFDLLVPHQ